MSLPLNSCSYRNQPLVSHGDQLTCFHGTLKRTSDSSSGLPRLSHTMTEFGVQRLSAFSYPFGGRRVLNEIARPEETGMVSLHPSVLTIKVENPVMSPDLLALRNRRFPRTDSLNPSMISVYRQGDLPQIESLNPNMSFNQLRIAPQSESLSPINRLRNAPQIQSLNQNLISINSQVNNGDPQTESFNLNLSINSQRNAAIAQGNRRRSPILFGAAIKSEPDDSSQIPQGFQNPRNTQSWAISRDGYDGITHSLPHKKNGPYTCPRCRQIFPTSQIFASHVVASHYRYESTDERKKRIRAKYKKRSLRISGSGKGLTVSPVNIFSLQAHPNSVLPSFPQGNPSASASMAGAGINERDKVSSAEGASSYLNFVGVKQEPVQ